MSMPFSGEDRFSMTAERYLGKHNVLVYLEDSIAQLLEHREENPKLNPIKFLSEYFNSLRDGNHTMFREYAFIKVTPHNRASFIRLFWKCFRQIGKKGDLLSIQEYHSLVTLLCHDFPYSTVQKTARIILLDDALDCLISFSDFIFAFQIQFYYEEFLDKCYEIYQSLLQTAHSPRNPVVVPSGAEETKIHQNSHNPSDGVDAMQYFRAVYPLCDRSTFRGACWTVEQEEALFQVNLTRGSWHLSCLDRFLSLLATLAIASANIDLDAHLRRKSVGIFVNTNDTCITFKPTIELLKAAKTAYNFLTNQGTIGYLVQIHWGVHITQYIPKRTPPADALKEILFNIPRVSFYGFLMALAKSESINESIGRLPAKAELLEGSDSELTSVLNVNTRASVQSVSILSSSVQPVNNVSGNNKDQVPIEREVNMNGTADDVPNVVQASNVPSVLNQKNGGLGRSPVIRMKGGKLRLEHPVNHNQSGPTANQTGAQSARPTSAAGGENKHTGKGSLSHSSSRKKESSDESSDESDDDDTSSDTN